MAGVKTALTFRPIVPEDEDFLYRVYASTRAEELALLDWDDAQKESFLHQQFTAQHSYYQEQFKAARFLLILGDGQPIGRLYVDRREEEIRLIDIALLPEHRGSGIGTELMNELLAEAAEAGKKVRIHVERFNPALSLYERLGFTRVEDQGVYFLMEWLPPQARGAAAR
jgi:ribosomal protein S18 acetylase RimI-like enzyme